MDKKQIDQYPAVIQPHLRMVSDTREALIAIIRNAVKKHGCIGTFYRNLGEHHTKDQTEEEFDNSPVVAIRNETYNSYGGFEGNTVYDLFIGPEDDKLLATLNGEAGEDFDEPIENVQVEGLLCIVSWLAENGFIENVAENPYRCEECGSLIIERQGWLNPNTEEFIGYTEQDDGDDNWCHDCEGPTIQILENELMVSIEDWFHNYLGPDDNEVISGLDPDNYVNYEAFLDACTGHWKSLSNEEKISLWKSLTYDKRCNETL